MARASSEAMPSWSHTAVAPTATTWAGDVGRLRRGPEHVHQPDLSGDVCQTAIHLFADDLGGLIEPSLDGGIGGEDLFDDVIGIGHMFLP